MISPFRVQLLFTKTIDGVVRLYEQLVVNKKKSIYGYPAASRTSWTIIRNATRWQGES